MARAHPFHLTTWGGGLSLSDTATSPEVTEQISDTVQT